MDGSYGFDDRMDTDNRDGGYQKRAEVEEVVQRRPGP